MLIQFLAQQDLTGQRNTGWLAVLVQLHLLIIIQCSNPSSVIVVGDVMDIMHNSTGVPSTSLRSIPLPGSDTTLISNAILTWNETATQDGSVAIKFEWGQ